MKRGKLLFSLLLGIFLISLVSAQYFGPNFGYGFFDPELITWGATFIIFFAVINFSLGRTVFREDRTTRAIIALAASLLAVYWLSNRRVDITNFYIGTGFGDFLSVIIPFVFLFGLIFLLYRFRSNFSWVLIILGLSFILLSQTNLIYEKGILLGLGIILLAIGVILKLKRPRIRRDRVEGDYGGGVSGRKVCRIIGWILALSGAILISFDIIGVILLAVGLLLLVVCRKPRPPRESVASRGELRQARQEEIERIRQKEWQDKLKKRYIRRYGKRAWRKRMRSGLPGVEGARPLTKAEKRRTEKRILKAEGKRKVQQKREIKERKKRNLYDLKQKLNSYNFEYNNARGNPQRQKRIKQAMRIIEKEIRRLS